MAILLPARARAKRHLESRDAGCIWLLAYVLSTMEEQEELEAKPSLSTWLWSHQKFPMYVLGWKWCTGWKMRHRQERTGRQHSMG